MRDGKITSVTVQYEPATGDSTVNGRPFREAYPPTTEHASTAPWYAANEPIRFVGVLYVKYGLARAFGASDLVQVGTYRGVPVFTEPGARPPYEVVYLPVSPDCLFQPYQGFADFGAVRG